MTLLGTICYVSLLMLNAIAILNEERFLTRIGWSYLSPATHSGFSYDQNVYGAIQGGVGVKARVVDLISAVRTLRIPLIVLNTLVILYELALG